MSVNGSELIDNPWETIFSPFTDFFGMGFWLLPLSFIAIALYVKTRDTTIVSVWLMASSLLLSSGSIFTGQPEMAFVFSIFTVLGIIGVVVSIYFMKR